MATAVASFPASELVLGRYRPLRPLGSGGSGSVWVARDERNGLDVALKIVPREGKAHTRAEREASAAARLRHPHCLRAYAFAGDQQNVYIAYEYVPGRTLRDRLRAGELDDAAVLEVAAQILDGLAHAHRHGIVHRDVKPTNVLVADSGEILVKLLDFGLAQFAEAETLTAAGDVPGTLAYISPERLAGEEASFAADVWAVGVLLWEALAGYHPFWSSSPVETGAAAALFTGATAALIPFYPEGWFWGLAAFAAGLAALRPRLGLAFALGAAVLPLGNVSLGLAIAYCLAALAWIVATWRRPEEGLFFVAGPLLAPLGATALVPLAFLQVRSAVWRGVHGTLAVLLAGTVAGLSGSTLPLSGRGGPELGVGGSEDVGAVFTALLNGFAARPELLLTALALGLVSALLPIAGRRGLWPLALLGAGSLAVMLLPVHAVHALPVVVGIWLCCAVFAVGS